jgi:hypothetical protein
MTANSTTFPFPLPLGRIHARIKGSGVLRKANGDSSLQIWRSSFNPESCPIRITECFLPNTPSARPSWSFSSATSTSSQHCSSRVWRATRIARSVSLPNYISAVLELPTDETLYIPRYSLANTKTRRKLRHPPHPAHQSHPSPTLTQPQTSSTPRPRQTSPAQISPSPLPSVNLKPSPSHPRQMRPPLLHPPTSPSPLPARRKPSPNLPHLSSPSLLLLSPLLSALLPRRSVSQT